MEFQVIDHGVSWHRLSLPRLQVSLVFFLLNLLLGSRGKCGSAGKADHAAPLITGEVQADEIRKVGLKASVGRLWLGGKERGCWEKDLHCSKVQKRLAGRESQNITSW